MVITIKNKEIEANISTKGAELLSLNKGAKNYIWNIDLNYWNKTSPVLFPIVGTLKNNAYQHLGHTYQLPRHGFARDLEFEVVLKTEDKVTFSLKNNSATLKNYPFLFELRICYILEDYKLWIEYEIINLSSEAMYFSIGAHPAFALEKPLKDYSLIFDSNKALHTYKLEQDLLSGETQSIEIKENTLPLQYALFEKDALIFKESVTQSLTLVCRQSPVLKVNFAGFPFLGIWTKKDAPFLCIEPWLGIADYKEATGILSEKEGIQSLDGHQKKLLSWNIECF